jgi:hypothetical protein
MPDALPQEPRDTTRRLTVDDLPWALSLGYRRYGPYDPGKILIYCMDAMRSRRALFIRTDRAFLLAALILPVWADTGDECNVLALCTEEGAVWEGVRLLRRSVRWARDNGCKKWWFGSETKHDVSKLAQRVGAEVTHPRYRIEF